MLLHASSASAPSAHDCVWPRVVLQVAMVDFVAAIERRDRAESGDRPLAVIDPALDNTIIALSSAARRLGLRPGSRLVNADGLVVCRARPQEYVATTARIHRALSVVSADVETSGADRFLIDATHIQHHGRGIEPTARLVQRLVREASGGLECAVGVAGSRVAAAAAAAQAESGSIAIIAPWEARARLCDLPYDSYCVKAPQVRGFLRRRGARVCGDVAAMPVEDLARRFGAAGRHVWLACQGRDPEPIHVDAELPKTAGHGRVLPPRTVSRRVIEAYLRELCERVAARLRRDGLTADRCYIGLRYGLDEGAAETFPLARGEVDGRDLLALALRLLRRHWRGEAVTHAQVTASGLRRAGGQLDLFVASRLRGSRVVASAPATD
jgi:DNA polymerase IV